MIQKQYLYNERTDQVKVKRRKFASFDSWSPGADFFPIGTNKLLR